MPDTKPPPPAKSSVDELWEAIEKVYELRKRYKRGSPESAALKAAQTAMIQAGRVLHKKGRTDA